MIATWWSWMAAMTVQIVVVVAAVALLERLLARRSSPRLAAALWMVALAKLAMPPTLGSPVSVARLAPEARALAVPEFAVAAFWIWLAGVAIVAALAIRRHLQLLREIRIDGLPPSESVLEALAREARRV